jgi:hypothetical protein
LYFALGQPQNSISDFKMALKLDPNNKNAKENLEKIQNSIGNRK